MNQIRAMGVRGRALLWLIGALALALAIGGRASADTCLNSNNWFFTAIVNGGTGSVDGAGTVTLTNATAQQFYFTPQTHHPVLSGTVHNVDSPQVSVSLNLYTFGGHEFVAGVQVALNQTQPDVGIPPYAYEGATWSAGSTSNFTIDVDAILAQHFPGMTIFQFDHVSNMTLELLCSGGTAQFGNLCLTVGSTPYTVTSLYDPNKAVKSGAVIPLKLQLRDAGGTNVSSSSLVVNATGLVQKDNQPDGVLTDAGNANADNNFRYDATLQGYIYNLKTTGLASGTWCLTFTVNGQSDPSYQLIFNVK